jgi:tripeptidyl-peptidase I
VGDNRDNPNDHRCWVQTPQTDNKNVTRFLPTFPSTCPYVTSVGGTTDIPETSIYFSGGGFSDYVRVHSPSQLSEY